MSAFHLPRNDRAIDRRSLIMGAGATALLSSGLVGCSGSGGETNSASSNASVQLPTYAPIEGAKPDFPGTEEGVEPAYKLFPSERAQTVDEKPGTGSETVTGMVNTYAAVPPSAPKNPFWQGLNERLGIDLQLQMTPNADYLQKFSTTIAGDDLPDMVLTQVVANFPSLLEKLFSPLDEYLSGDAIKDYPNLANIPTQIWKTVVYNGHIFGLPLPRGLINSYHFIRADIFAKAGVSTEPKSYDELIDAGKAVTDPKKRRWAYSMIGQPRALLARMNEEPNGWANNDGSFVHAFETDAFQRTVSDLIEMWKSGVMHPDAFNPQQPFKELFAAGNNVINANDGYTGFNAYQADGEVSKGFELGLMPIYKRGGGELAPWALGSGSFGMASIKKADPERIKLCLRMANYLAAPFGSEEYFYLSYGEEKTDHTIDQQGNPSLTDTGQRNTAVPMRYLGDSPKASYSPGRPQDAKKQHDYQSMEIPQGVANASTGLFSNTHATKNATAEKKLLDGLNQIVQGRQPYSELKSVVSTWRSAAGDAIRKEYEEQMQNGAGDQ